MQSLTDLLPPGLYFVATPIGNARDITLRALDVLASADVLAAEDTRNTRRLLDIHGIPLNDRPLIAYHDHNGARVRPKLLDMMRAGKAVAYASDAGTPLVADPGYGLMRAAIDADIAVTSTPGPSAVMAALAIAGLPTDKFIFAGFSPTAKGARAKFLEKFATQDATLVLFESAKRTEALLIAASEVFGENRNAAICRELTKKFEEARRGTIAELLSSIGETPLKGEVVVLFERGTALQMTQETLDYEIKNRLNTMRVKDIATELASQSGLPRKEIYARTLELKDSNDGTD